MKKIKIFLASSITDLKVDRIEVGDFFRQLNEIYFDRGIHFSLLKCEDCDNAITSGGKQEEYDNEIRDSELVFFLFFKKVGDYTKHEFEVALEAYRNCNKPKIVTYFKYVNTPEEAKGDVKEFMQVLDGEIKHYYNIYQNIDTLKLGILMQIKLMQLDAEDPRIEDGKVMFGNIGVASVSNIPMIAENRSIENLRKQLKEISEFYLDLQSRYLQDRQNLSVYKKYSEVAAQKAKIEEQLRLAEKSTLSAIKDMYEKTAQGDLSQRQVAAYRAFELGDYIGALEILDFDEIMNDISHNSELGDYIKARLQINVNELLQRIEILKSGMATSDKVEEIIRLYKTAEEIAEKYNLNKNFFYNYACFLVSQNNFSAALTVAQKLKSIYEYPDNKKRVSEEDKAKLFNVLGVIYRESNHYKNSEEAFLESTEEYQKLAKDQPHTYEPDLAMVYNNLGGLYCHAKRYNEAEKILLKAVEINEKLVQAHPDTFESLWAMCCINLSSVYRDEKRYSEAERLLLKATETNKKLAQARNTFEADLAGSYNNLGILYCDMQRYNEAEEVHLKSVEIYEKFAKCQPDSYEPYLAMSYNNLGDLYNNTKRYKEAEGAHLKATEIYEKLASVQPDAFESHLVKCYANLGDLYKETQRYKEAENVYLKGIEICERVSQSRHDVFEPDYLASRYINLGNLYKETQQYKEAEEEYLKAIKVYENLVLSQPGAFDAGLAYGYNFLGILYDGTKRYKEAEVIKLKAIAIFEKLAKTNPDEYESYLAMNYDNLGGVYWTMQRHKEAENAYLKAMKIYEKLAKTRPDTVETDLADICFMLGVIYTQTKNRRAKKYLSIALQYAKKHKDTNPHCKTIYDVLTKSNK